MSAVSGYPIKVVVRRTGLTPHVIRMWEKRYQAVIPERTPTNRRLYSDDDIMRLALLRQATLVGHSIGQIAQLPAPALRTLVAADRNVAAVPPPAAAVFTLSAPTSHLDLCLAAAQQLDAGALEAAFMQAAVALGQTVLLEQIIIPFIYRVGEAWRDGSLRIMHEHLVSMVTRTFLESMRSAFKVPASAPSLVVTTPAGQMHEFGALLAAATAAAEGWRVIYLGGNLPAEEIAGALQHTQANVLGLSIVYPPDDPHLSQELFKLRRALPDEAVLLVGGRAAPGYQDTLHAIAATHLHDLAALRLHLETLRAPHSPAR